MKLSILLAVVALAAMLGAGEAAPQEHPLSGNVFPGAGGKPLVDFNPYRGKPLVDFNPYRGKPLVDFNPNRGKPLVDFNPYRGKPLVDFNPNKNLNLNAGVSKKHSLSGNVSPGAGGKPLVDLSYGFNPNKNLNLNAGVSHQFGGDTSYGVGFKWRFRRDAKLEMD